MKVNDELRNGNALTLVMIKKHLLKLLSVFVCDGGILMTSMFKSAHNFHIETINGNMYSEKKNISFFMANGPIHFHSFHIM